MSLYVTADRLNKMKRKAESFSSYARAITSPVVQVESFVEELKNSTTDKELIKKSEQLLAEARELQRLRKELSDRSKSFVEGVNSL